MKKKLFVCLFAIMILSVQKVCANTVDTNPPVLNSISFTSEPVKPGDIVYLNLDVFDDLSGIESADINFIGNFGLNSMIYDIDTNPYIKIPANKKSGDYEILELSFRDKAGNVVYYVNSKRFDSVDTGSYPKLAYDFTNVLKIEGDNTDLENPTIEDFNIKVENGIATLEIKCYDNQSGIQTARVGYIDKNNQSNFFQLSNGPYDNEKQIFTISYPTSGFPSNSTYTIYSIDVYDNVGNFDTIHMYGPQDNPLVKKINNTNFTVSDSITDSEAPIFKEIKLSKTVANNPSIVKIELLVEDNGSGMQYETHLIFDSKDSKNALYADLTYDYENKKYVGELEIDQYAGIGKYYLVESSLYDLSNNEYRLTSSDVKDITINVVSGQQYDVTTSTTSSDLLNVIKNAKDDALISIDSTNDSIIKKEVFEAIKGTNKRIYIETNGIEWIFNGKDIVNPKDIDTNVSIEMIYNSDDELLKNALEKAIIVNFAQNGELPGKALIRIKADYTFRNYIGEDNLYIYYYNTDTSKLDKVAINIGMNEEAYYSFYIDHNSIFAISQGEAKEEYVSEDESNLELNNNTEKSNEKDTKKSNNNYIYITVAFITSVIYISVIGCLVYKKRKKKN